jgi:hypothetical protein
MLRKIFTIRQTLQYRGFMSDKPSNTVYVLQNIEAAASQLRARRRLQVLAVHHGPVSTDRSTTLRVT